MKWNNLSKIEYKKIFPESISIILIAIAYISFSESACSSANWTAVSNYDTSKILGRWYVTRRYANGQHGHAHCLWSSLAKHPTLADTMVETTNLLFKNGKSKTKRTTSRNVTFLDPTKPEGIVRVKGPNGSVVIKYIVALSMMSMHSLRVVMKVLSISGSI